MLKVLLNITLVLLVFSIIIIPVKAEWNVLELNPVNILSSDQIDIAIDGTTVSCNAVKQNDTLYLDIGFFTTYFKKSIDDFKNAGLPMASLKEGMNEVPYIPAIKALEVIGVRYTYNPIFSKDIMRIRTDNNFKVDPTYVYKPTDVSSQGNLPDTSKNPPANIIYTPSVYSVTPGYGYYYPPGYQPGFYFGNYGFINQGPNVPNVYNGPSVSPLHIDF